MIAYISDIYGNCTCSTPWTASDYFYITEINNYDDENRELRKYYEHLAEIEHSKSYWPIYKNIQLTIKYKYLCYAFLIIKRKNFNNNIGIRNFKKIN